MIKFNIEKCDANTEMIARYQDLSDMSAREYLVEKIDPMIKGYAYRLYSNLLRKKVEFDDVLSDCYLGFLNAVEKYDRSRGFEFKKYLGYKMRQSVIDGIRSRDKGERKAMDLERLLGDKLEGNYSDEELRKITGWKRERFQSAISAYRMKHAASLDSEVYEDMYNFGDLIEDKSADFTGYVLLKSRIEEVLKQMSERDRKVVFDRINGITLSEIGKEIGVSEARVCNIMGKFRESL